MPYTFSMVIRYDLHVNELSDLPQLVYFIKDECRFAYNAKKVFTHTIAEIYYVIEGMGNLQVNGKVYKLHGGDYFVINPYVQHGEFLERKKEEQFTYYILGITNFTLLPQGEQDVYVPRRISPRDNIVYLLDKIFDELNGKRQSYKHAAEHYFALLLLETERLYGGKIEKSFHASSDIAAQIRNYIDVNYAGEISAKSIAEHFGKKLNTIEIKFKKSFGLSMQSYILVKRIEGAKRMLESNGNMPVAECAIKMGFYNPAYFSRCFKKIVGLSPRKYRNRFLQNIP